VIPYEARHSIQIPAKIQRFIDISEEALAELVDDDPITSSSKVAKKYKGKDLLFDKVRLRVTPEDFEDSETSEEEGEEEKESFGLDEEPEAQGPRKLKRSRS
jgi:hypothetical protein